MNANLEHLVDALTARLHPLPYPDLVATDPGGPLLRLVKSPGLFGARYALGFAAWDPTADPAGQLARARGAIRSATGALWLLREVGAYVIFVGPEAAWRPHTDKLVADKTGLHAVIIQAVHFIDPETGARHLNQSAWGPVRFGGVDSVAARVEGHFSEA